MASNQNAALLRGLSEQAEALVCDASKNSFPVLLPPLAARRRVTAVEFRPLLVDAMLTTHTGGFRFIFNSGGGDPNALRLQYECESAGQLMPPRLRFSLAHELAHTLFYDLSDETPRLSRQFRSGGGRTELENLERYCNRLAAGILLPKPLLRRSLQRLSRMQPCSLMQLADQAGVSVEALVRRLSDQPQLLVQPYFPGCIVLAKETSNETTVMAVAKPQRIDIATGLLLMQAGERWQLPAADGSPLQLKNLPSGVDVSLFVETPAGKSQRPYHVLRTEIGRSGSAAATHLLTFEEIGRS